MYPPLYASPLLELRKIIVVLRVHLSKTMKSFFKFLLQHKRNHKQRMSAATGSDVTKCRLVEDLTAAALNGLQREKAKTLQTHSFQL